MSGLPSWPWSARREHPEMDDVHDTERSPVYHDDDELRTIVVRTLEQRVDDRTTPDLRRRVEAGELDPYAAADELLADLT